MFRFNGSAVLPDDTPLTAQQLIQAAIEARTYPSAKQKSDAKRRWTSVVSGGGFFRPQGNVYTIDAYKGVRNGIVINDESDDPIWIEADFTASPGGGEIVEGGTSRYFDKEIDFGHTVLYQHSGADVVIYFNVFIK